MRQKNILNVCGELCNLNQWKWTPEPNYGYFGENSANIDCKALFKSTLLDEPSNLCHFTKLQDIPAECLDDYSMNGKVDIQEWWIEDTFLGKQAKISVKSKEEYVSKALKEDFEGRGDYMQLYPITLFHVLQNVRQVRNISVVVIRSESPWISIASEEKNFTTLEYGHIESNHPKINTMTPEKFQWHIQMVFREVWCYSSIEHSGLGRYGDSLNPFGDIMTVARACCVTKKRGSLTLGVSSSGEFSTSIMAKFDN